MAKIENYAMIGDCKTAALVSLDGSIDWLCLPRFDSMSCFAKLLGANSHGCWQISPSKLGYVSTRSYVDGTLILKTRFECLNGVVVITDFMPTSVENSHIVRTLEGVHGCVSMKSNLIVRFDYGLTTPWISKGDNEEIQMIAGPDLLVLRAGVESRMDDGMVASEFDVNEGEKITFVLSHGPSHLPAPLSINGARQLQETQSYWTQWSSRCRSAGRWSKNVTRSLITLKGLTYIPTGGIVAAVTTSLPEQIGGERNWDYRYCWLRDTTFTLLALLTAGYNEEADSWREWLLRAAAGDPGQIQIMYGVAGEKRLEEWTLPWLPGYENSTPVRVGNEAAGQIQLDVYGELFNAMSVASEGKVAPLSRGLELRVALLDHLEQIWSKPDAGIWEIRGDPQHFTHSKIMAWVAFDRAAKSDYFKSVPEARKHYRCIADEIHKNVCQNAVDQTRNCFVQVYGKVHLDASLLLIPKVGFLPQDDARVRNTVAEIEHRLLKGNLVSRYETSSGVDGLSSGEGAFLACSFWLVDNYILQGRLDEAEALFDRLVKLGNDVGLFAEEYDPVDQRQLGNFPQAFSHVALINSAFALSRAKNAADDSN